MRPRIARPLACCAAVLAGSFLAGPFLAFAQEKKKDDDKSPRVILTSPLAVSPDSTTTIKVRGLRLAEATEVRFPGATRGIKAVVKSKGKAEAVAGFEPAVVGETQVEVELAVPPDAPAGELPFVVITPAGEAKPYELLVIEAKSLVQEKEPNDGFRQAQLITVSKVVQGSMQGGDDVDVFRIEGKSGQKLVAEVVASRRGSALDSLLTLYDAAGHVLASNDDADVEGEAQADSVLHFRFPSDGNYYVALTDANARGGPTHPYLLMLKADE